MIFKNHSELIIGKYSPIVGDFCMAVITVNKIQGKMVTAQAKKIMKSNLSSLAFEQFCQKAHAAIKNV